MMHLQPWFHQLGSFAHNYLACSTLTYHILHMFIPVDHRKSFCAEAFWNIGMILKWCSISSTHSSSPPPLLFRCSVFHFFIEHSYTRWPSSQPPASTDEHAIGQRPVAGICKPWICCQKCGQPRVCRRKHSQYSLLLAQMLHGVSGEG